MIRKIKQISKSEFGFTLIEVMVVIIMVGILAAIAVPIYSNYVYRARTSEGVATLGAIKTYMLERSNATGRWPNLSQLKNEFNDFKELYYFQDDLIVLKPASVSGANDNELVPIATTPHIAIELTVDPDNFGKTGDTLQLDIDVDETDNNGWSGTVRDNWAKHLPPVKGSRIN